MAYAWKNCIQSWCFRGTKDNRIVADGIRACGFAAAEVSGAHADFRNPATFADTLAPYRALGVEVPTVGVCLISNDEARDRGFFDFAKAAGAGTISVTFSVRTYPDVLKGAERLAEEYGVDLAIHNHGAHDWLGTGEVLDHVFSRTSPRIGLCLDSAWAIDSGEDPVKMAGRFKDRVRTVHIKDFVYDRAGRNEDVIPGEGNLDLAGFLGVLARNGFAGNAVIEYEGGRDNPLPSLKKCAEKVLGAMAGL